MNMHLSGLLKLKIVPHMENPQAMVIFRRKDNTTKYFLILEFYLSFFLDFNSLVSGHTEEVTHSSYAIQNIKLSLLVTSKLVNFNYQHIL